MHFVKSFIILALPFFLNQELKAQKNTFKNLTSSFTFQMTFTTKHAAAVSHVIYGNSKYGFFRTKPQNKTKNSFEINFIPPGYKHKINFFIRYSQNNAYKFKFLKSVKIKKKYPDIFDSISIDLVHGKFSNPFFLLNGSLAKQMLLNSKFNAFTKKIRTKENLRFSYLMIINRFGEIVWLNVPDYKNKIFSAYIASKQPSPGVFAYILSKKSSYAAALKSDGEYITKVSTKNALSPFTIHHDFIFGENNSFITFTTQSNFLKTSLLTNEKKTFLADKVIKFSENKKNYTNIVNLLDFYTPRKNIYESFDKKYDKKFVTWNKPKADFEFMHSNSISSIPGEGYMVGIRNLHKIVQFDFNFKKIEWTFGTNKIDTHFIKNTYDRFSHAHTPTILGNGNLLLFDNGIINKKSRLVIYNLDNKNTRAVWSWSPNTELYSKNRSSVYQIQNKNLVAYFVAPVQAHDKQIKNQDILIEVNLDKKEVARLNINFDTLSPGYRATPLKTVNKDIFIGFRPKHLLKLKAE